MLPLSLLILAGTLGVPASIEDWPRLRGPEGRATGTSELPTSLEDLKWSVDLGGGGSSSPVIAEGRLVVTVERGEGGGRDVLALDAETGEQLWRQERLWKPAPMHRLNSRASSTPVLAEGRIHLLWTSGGRLEALTLNAEDGEELWSRDLGPFHAQHGSGVSPALIAGHLIVSNEHEAPGSFLLGLDPATGETRWTLERPSTDRRGSYATPTPLHRDGKPPLALSASTACGLTAIHPVTGKVVWEFDAAFTQRCVGSPLVCRGKDGAPVIFQAAGSGGGGKEYVALRVTATGAEVAWSPRLRALPYVPTPVAKGELLFLVSDAGVATAIDAVTGNVLWQERLDGGVYASPILAGDTLLVATLDGALIRLTAGREPKRLGSFSVGAPIKATPAIAQGTLYVRAGTRLMAFE